MPIHGSHCSPGGHGNEPCVTKKNPHLANSTTSTASGAAICLIIGPNWCTKLYSRGREGSKSTENETWSAVIPVVCSPGDWMLKEYFFKMT